MKRQRRVPCMGPFAEANVSEACKAKQVMQEELVAKDKQLFFEEYYSRTTLYKFIQLRQWAQPLFLQRNLKYSAIQRSGGKKKLHALQADDLLAFKKAAKSQDESRSIFLKHLRKQLVIELEEFSIDKAFPFVVHERRGQTTIRMLMHLCLDGEKKYQQLVDIPVEVISSKARAVFPFVILLDVNFLQVQGLFGEWELLFEILKADIADSQSSTQISKASIVIGKIVSGQLRFRIPNSFKLSFHSNPDLSWLPFETRIHLGWKYSSTSKKIVPSQLPLSAAKPMISPQSVEPSQPVSYAFFYDSNRRNLKEFLKNTSCSWCGLRCKSLHSLLYHLLCSHDRFNFFLKLSGSPQVEVYPSPTLKLTEFTTRDDFASNMESFSYYIGKAGQGLKNYISELLKICPGVPDDWENFHLRRILHPQSKSKHISGKRKHASDSNLQEDNLESIVLPIEESQEHQISSSSKRNRKRSSRSPSSSYALKANVSRRGEVSSLGRMTKGFHHASSMSLFDDKDHEQIIDSDEDAPQEWRIELERKDIENLKDATFSEKKLMLMWNEFVQKSAPHADFAFPSYLLKFVKNQKDEILLGNLRLAFLSHLMTLWEFGLIQAHHIEASISILDSSQKS